MRELLLRAQTRVQLPNVNQRTESINSTVWQFMLTLLAVPETARWLNAERCQTTTWIER